MTKSSLRTCAQIPSYPDPERAEALLRLGDEITETSATSLPEPINCCN